MSAPGTTDRSLITPENRRRRGFWASAQRQANTVFLFFMNPFLDEDTKRLSGTRCMAWTVVYFNSYDITHSHSLQELARLKTATSIDAVDIHNVELYALAAVIWYGKWGFEMLVKLVKAWKGEKE